MTHISLFSGIGGIDLAAEWAGFRTVAVCDIDQSCRAVLAARFPHAQIYDDVRSITAVRLRSDGIGRPTLVSAGFPCQPFSVAGRRGGTADERHLWPEVARVLCETQPRWFLGENVRGLLSISHGRVFGAILADLADLGYRVGWGCYGADEAAGSPHRRDRTFIVGYLADRSSGGLEGRGLSARSRDQGDRALELDRGGASLGNSQGDENDRRESRGVGEAAIGRRRGDPAAGDASRTMADSLCRRCGGRHHGDARGLRREVQTAGPCPGSDGAMADTECGRHERRGEPRELSRTARESCAEGDRSDICGDAADRQGFGMADSTKRRARPQQDAGAESAERGSEGLERRGTEQLGRDCFGVFPPGPTEFDRWWDVLSVRPDLAPALTTEEEAELEVRRVANGVPGRVVGLTRRQRLKMLGNAVVPQQVYPILKAIAEVERG